PIQAVAVDLHPCGSTRGQEVCVHVHLLFQSSWLPWIACGFGGADADTAVDVRGDLSIVQEPRTSVPGHLSLTPPLKGTIVAGLFGRQPDITCGDSIAGWWRPRRGSPVHSVLRGMRGASTAQRLPTDQDDMACNGSGR